MSAVPPDSANPSDGNTLLVRRGRVESVDLYEIKDSELDQLEKGTQGDLHSTFAVFFISSALSCGLALASADFHNKKVETFFMLVTLCGSVGGIYQGILWWRSRTAIAKLCERIKDRIAPEKKLIPAANVSVAPVGIACGVVSDGIVMGVDIEVDVASPPANPPAPTQPAG